MGTREPGTYDVVGIGFGPSNLSLAIALDELPAADGDALRTRFFERQPSFGWHSGMLLPTAKMQISFLKDLATFRNPTSRFSFVAYLHELGRLPQFVNSRTFFPTRRDFHGYLEWAQSSFAASVTYGSAVTGVRLRDGRLPAAEVEVDVVDAAGVATTVSTRNLVVSTGLVPRMPAGVERGDRVWHSSEFLHRFQAARPGELNRVAVVGAGQSAAEIVRFVHDTLPDAMVVAILPPYGYAVADSTPFANQVFDPGAVDDYFYGLGGSKSAIWEYHKNTNYSVVDEEVIRDLYQRAYDDEVADHTRISFVNLARVLGVEQLGDGARVGVRSTMTGQTFDVDVDVLVCATGYDPMDPARVLGEVADLCLRDERGQYRVARDYRLVTVPELRCGIYVQGGTEHTHGLSSSLLSNLAVRSGEIAQSIAARRADPLTDDLLVAEATGR